MDEQENRGARGSRGDRQRGGPNAGPFREESSKGVQERDRKLCCSNIEGHVALLVLQS
jgi:hypothetical protein